MWAAPCERIGHGGPERRNRPLHGIHRPTPGWGHSYQSGVWLFELQKKYVLTHIVDEMSLLWPLQPNKCMQLCARVSTEEFAAFFDRLAFVRKCEQVAGSELTTRTNVLLVRQNLLTPGNGVVLTYSSQKNTKKSHHQGKSESAFWKGSNDTWTEANDLSLLQH